VIGGLTAKCSEAAVALYKIFVEGECVVTNARTAEMCKLTENASRDVAIAFANELSIICDKLNIDVWELIRLANRHPRVNILQPGPGVGGHCIAVDPWFIVDKTPDEARLIHAAREINDYKPHWIQSKVEVAMSDLAAATGRDKKDLKISCFGLAFKPDIDDLRESPALEITLSLAKLFPGQVSAVEPNIAILPASMNGSTISLIDVKQAIVEADILVLLVDHKSFKDVPPPLYKNKTIVDAKGIWC